VSPILTNELIVGDVRTILATLPAESVQCVVTSPPYWGLRDYGVADQLGLEATPEEYVKRMAAVFAEVRRVLRSDGTLWLNMGDSYAANRSYQVVDTKHTDVGNSLSMQIPPGLKPKDLVGMPWRLAFALQADGWYLRSDIIWSKPNPMPESVTDRPTKAHEYLFLLTKSARYYYDADAIRESAGTFTKMPDGWDTGPGSHGSFHRQGREKGRRSDKQSDIRGAQVSGGDRTSGFNDRWDASEANGTAPLTRNKRTVWTIATQPYPEAHFATFPEDLVEPCILAGTKPCDLVLDPFAGSGTTLAVAKRLDRDYLGIELNPAYVTLAERRLAQEGRQMGLLLGTSLG
jgi:DNA modification methylase